jgi:xanthine dehydrogenase molybdopterin-binding subunit B
MLGISVWEALRDAVAQAKATQAEVNSAQTVCMNAPATPERVLAALKT